MALYYNTETFANINSDLISKIDSGLVTPKTMESYLERVHDTSLEDWNAARAEALEAEKLYYKAKEQPSYLPSWMGYSQSLIPAHLKDKERSNFRAAIELLPNAFFGFPRLLTKGTTQTTEMGGGTLLGEKFKEQFPETAQDITETTDVVSQYISDIIPDYFKKYLDPKTSTTEEIVTYMGLLLASGGRATQLIRPRLGRFGTTRTGGITSRILGFSAADLLLTDKNQTVVTQLLKEFPETLEALEFLSVNPDDSDGIKILKNVGEIVGFNLIGEAVLLPIIAAYKGLKGIRRGVEDNIAQNPKDDSGVIKGVQVEKNNDGTLRQRIFMEQPVFLPTDKKYGKAPTFFGRWLGSNQGLDPSTYRAIGIKEGRTGELEQILKTRSDGLERALGKKTSELDDETVDIINIALGKPYQLPDELIPKYIHTILNKSSKKWTQSDKKKLNEFQKYRDKYEIDRAREAGDKALSSLDPKVQDEIRKMRTLIDRASREIIETGIPGRELVARLDRKLGLYVTTDYELFSNPIWLNAVKNVLYKRGVGPWYQQAKSKVIKDDVEALEALNSTRKFFKSNYLKTDGIELTDTQIDEKMLQFLNKINTKDEYAFLNLLFPGSTGKQSEHYFGKILSAKKGVPKELGKLFKEVTDPAERFRSTLRKQGRLLAEHYMYQDIADIAMSTYGKNIYKFEDPVRNSIRFFDELRETAPKEAKEILEKAIKEYRLKEKKLGHNWSEDIVAEEFNKSLHEIIGKRLENGGNFVEDLGELASGYIKQFGENSNPLSGVLVTPEFKSSVRALLNDYNDPSNPALLALYRANALASGAKTILSHPTHLINIQGNIAFLGGNGHLFPTSVLSAKSKLDAIQILTSKNPGMANLFKVGQNKVDLNLEEFKELQALGLVNEGVNAEYFLRAFDDIGKYGVTDPRHANKLTKILGKTYRGLGRIYRAEDSIFKIFAYYSELADYRPVFAKALASGEMTEAQLKKYAAEIARDTLPTYGKVPRLLKETRKNVPVVTAFPSFLIESTRATKNTLKFGGRDVLKGMADGNPALIKKGMKRLAGATAVGVLGSQFFWESSLENGVSATDNRIVETLSPLFAQNSVKVWDKPFSINPKTGRIESTYTDLSRSDPYTGFRQLTGAFWRNILKPIPDVVEGKTSGEDAQRKLERFVDELSVVAQPLTAMGLGIGPYVEWAIGKDKRDIGQSWIGKLGEQTVKTIGPGSFIDIWKWLTAQESEKNLGKGMAASEFGFPNRPDDRFARLYGVSRRTFDFNRALQGKVAHLGARIRNINSEVPQLLTKLGNTGYAWNDQEKVKEFYEIINGIIKRSYTAQQDLAKVLHQAKKFSYFETLKNGNTRRTTVGANGNVMLQSILQSAEAKKDLRKLDKFYDGAILSGILSGKVGAFESPKLPKGFRGRPNLNIPKSVFDTLETFLDLSETTETLAGGRRKMIPLLTLEEED